MKIRSLKEWADFYTIKTNDIVNLLPGFRLYYLPNRGFATMKIDFEAKMLIIDQVAGDANFWRDMAEVCMAQANGLDVIATTCNRDLMAYMRLFDAEMLDIESVGLENGTILSRYLFQDNIGRAVLASPRCINKQGKVEYWVTQYLKIKARPTIKEFLESQAGEKYVENQNDTTL